MTQVSKIDSGVVGLRFAEETVPGTLIGSPIWYPLDPNSYSEFGQTLTTIARTPITQSRQRKKGVITDINAAAGFDIDLTQTNLQRLLQGFFFANFREKGTFTDIPSVTVQVGNDTYEITTTAGFQVGSIVMASGFGVAENNGLKNVTAVVADTSIAVSQTLANEVTPPADSKLVCVGFKFDSADINVDASGTYPAITSTAKDFTQLGLNVGEFVYLGGDSAPVKFVTAANNGFKRVRTIAANRIEFDKSDSAMVTETGTGLTIQMFFGRVLKNELGTSIVTKPIQLERTLGAPDNASPNAIQAQYIEGCVPNTLALNLRTADKITCSLAYIGLRDASRTAAQGLKSGTRPTLIDSDAFNTSTDFSRTRLSKVESGNEAPTPLFAFMQDFNLTISNNVKANKAIGVVGAFDVSSGTFAVSGNLTAYFSTIEAVQAVTAASDVTFDMVVAKANSGFAVDLPLLTLGDGKLGVTQDEPVTLPLSLDAASAVKFGASFDYTLLMCFFDYLPTAAEG